MIDKRYPDYLRIWSKERRILHLAVDGGRKTAQKELLSSLLSHRESFSKIVREAGRNAVF